MARLRPVSLAAGLVDRSMANLYLLGAALRCEGSPRFLLQTTLKFYAANQSCPGGTWNSDISLQTAGQSGSQPAYWRSSDDELCERLSRNVAVPRKPLKVTRQPVSDAEAEQKLEGHIVCMEPSPTTLSVEFCRGVNPISPRRLFVVSESRPASLPLSGRFECMYE